MRLEYFQMVDRVVAEYGRLDMAFNNAGIQVPPSDAADEPIKNFGRVTAVNPPAAAHRQGGGRAGGP